jgi:hypothetical protein
MVFLFAEDPAHYRRAGINALDAHMNMGLLQA